MKIIKSIIVTCLLLIAASGTQAQSTSKTDTAVFKVNGVCEACKARIENAAYIKGVKSVNWDKFTKELTLIYRTDKTSIGAVQKSISAVGHSTETMTCNEDAYNGLPQCCKYHDGATTH